jgi:hypothetical protein
MWKPFDEKKEMALILGKMPKPKIQQQQQQQTMSHSLMQQ